MHLKSGKTNEHQPKLNWSVKDRSEFVKKSAATATTAPKKICFLSSIDYIDHGRMTTIN